MCLKINYFNYEPLLQTINCDDFRFEMGFLINFRLLLFVGLFVVSFGQEQFLDPLEKQTCDLETNFDYFTKRALQHELIQVSLK